MNFKSLTILAVLASTLSLVACDKFDQDQTPVVVNNTEKTPEETKDVNVIVKTPEATQEKIIKETSTPVVVNTTPKEPVEAPKESIDPDVAKEDKEVLKTPESVSEAK